MPTDYSDMGPLPAQVGESIAEVICRLIEADNHYFGTRPCQTCTAVSALVGRPFGCVKRVQEKNKS